MSRTPTAFGLAAIAALAVEACDSGDNLGTEKPVATVSVTPATSTISPGGTVQLQAVTKDADGRSLTERKITWSSSNEFIATVSATGLVTGVTVGIATITGTSEGQSGEASITVTMAALEFVSVSAGFGHTCGIVVSGKAYCWGRNGFAPDTGGRYQSGGQLGDGSTDSSSVPVAVSGGLTFSSVSPGMDHTCGLTVTGAAYCWGSNDFEQLGNGSSVFSSQVPVAVSGGLAFAGVSAGGTHNCASTSIGAAYCWGLNANGRLGDGSTDASSVPVAVTGGLRFSQVSASGLSFPAGHTCGLTSDGAVYCWGGNEWGQLGDGSTSDRSVPVAVTGGRTFSAVAAGVGHTCGLAAGGAAYCWGANGHGQLGDGSNTYVSAPVAVAGGLRFSALTSGALHSCGITAGGAAHCWGENDHGQLGNNSNMPSSIPVGVLGNLQFQRITGGAYHTCGLTTAGALYCWGRNDVGQLGNGTLIGSPVPIGVVTPR